MEDSFRYEQVDWHTCIIELTFFKIWWNPTIIFYQQCLEKIGPEIKKTVIYVAIVEKSEIRNRNCCNTTICLPYDASEREDFLAYSGYPY